MYGKWRPFCLGLNGLKLKTVKHVEHIELCLQYGTHKSTNASQELIIEIIQWLFEKLQSYQMTYTMCFQNNTNERQVIIANTWCQ